MTGGGGGGGGGEGGREIVGFSDVEPAVDLAGLKPFKNNFSHRRDVWSEGPIFPPARSDSGDCPFEEVRAEVRGGVSQVVQRILGEIVI